MNNRTLARSIAIMESFDKMRLQTYPGTGITAYHLYAQAAKIPIGQAVSEIIAASIVVLEYRGKSKSAR